MVNFIFRNKTLRNLTSIETTILKITAALANGVTFLEHIHNLIDFITVVFGSIGLSTFTIF
jgi:hypothetical protein